MSQCLPNARIIFKQATKESFEGRPISQVGKKESQEKQIANKSRMGYPKFLAGLKKIISKL